MNVAETIEKQQKLLGDNYIVSNVSDEEWREIETSDITIRIVSPIVLIRRKGGSTHRVIDINGITHCYVVPESGKSIIRWKADPFVTF